MLCTTRHFNCSHNATSCARTSSMCTRSDVCPADDGAKDRSAFRGPSHEAHPGVDTHAAGKVTTVVRLMGTMCAEVAGEPVLSAARTQEATASAVAVAYQRAMAVGHAAAVGHGALEKQFAWLRSHAVMGATIPNKSLA